MVEYKNKLTSAVNNQTGMNIKLFEGKNYLMNYYWQQYQKIS